MGTIVGAMLTSHAFAFSEPSEWDDRRRNFSMKIYAQLHGHAPAERAEMASETLADNIRRFATIRDGQDELRRRLKAFNADAVVMIGNDQDEDFRFDCLPQFAVFSGERFLATNRAKKERVEYRAMPALARAILETSVEADFDPSIILRFSNDELVAHAYRDALRVFDPDSEQAVVPIFVKTIHPPSPSPRRCYAFGQVLREAIERCTEVDRVVLFASGGFSHFPPDFPWAEYSGPATYGAISADFDRRLIDHIRSGNGAALAELSSDDLFENGDLELRQTIVMLGAVGAEKPVFLHYEPFYRAIMGLAVGCWDFEHALA